MLNSVFSYVKIQYALGLACCKNKFEKGQTKSIPYANDIVSGVVSFRKSNYVGTHKLLEWVTGELLVKVSTFKPSIIAIPKPSYILLHC